MDIRLKTNSELNSILEDCASDCSDDYYISAAVFLSSLDS